MSNNKETVQSIVKAINILDTIALSSNQELGITELSKQLSIGKSNVHRIVTTLEGLKVIEQTEHGKYRLGPRLARFGFQSLQQMDIRTVGRPLMTELVKKTGETVNLGIPQNGELLTIDKVDSEAMIRVSINIGKLSKMHCTGMGKAILAHFPNEMVEQIIKEHGMEALTPNTITSLAELKVDLANIRQRGYAINDIENNEGVRSVAAPIFDHREEVVGAISISASIISLTVDKIDSYGKEVSKTANEISQKLGYLPSEREVDSQSEEQSTSHQ